MTADELIAKYKPLWDTLSEREKGLAEKEIWEACDRSVRKRWRRRNYLAVNISRTEAQVQVRETLINAGEVAEDLWRRIDAGTILPRTAQKLLCRAKERAGKGETLQSAVDQLLAVYDSLPVVKTADGREFRRRNPSDLPRPEHPKPKKRGKKDEDSRRFVFTQIRELVGTYMADRFEGLDPIMAERLWMDFGKQLNALLNEFQGRVYRHAKSERETQNLLAQISRRVLIEACHTLRMDPPRVGAPVNMTIAKRQKRTLARVYHPDANAGDHSMTSQYDEVVKAFDLIEQYNRQIGSPGGGTDDNRAVS